jgi:large subunit ribosomal protein L33
MAGKSKKKLEIVHLVCEETGDYNYTIRKKGGGEKLKLKKFSPRLARRKEKIVQPVDDWLSEYVMTTLFSRGRFLRADCYLRFRCSRRTLPYRSVCFALIFHRLLAARIGFLYDMLD